MRLRRMGILTIIGAVLLLVASDGLALAALTRTRQRGGRFTTICAILGFVVGGVLALAAFYVGLAGLILVGSGEEEIDALLPFALAILFTVPILLLGSVIGTTIGALVGGRIDRRRGKESIICIVLVVPCLVNGALCVVFSLPAIILGAYCLHEDAEIGWLWLVVGIGIGAVAVGAALCFLGWRVGRRSHLTLQHAP